jgi:multidrug resistance efflux pump
MKTKLLVAILLLLLGAAFFWGFKRYNGEKPLRLSGSIEARDVEVGSLVGGRVEQVHVDEGDHVKAGEPIVTLDASLLNFQIREQESLVEQAQANLLRVRKGPRSEELQRAKLEWGRAEGERKRLEALYREGVIGKQQYDNAVTAAATALQAYRELQRGSRAEDIAAAEAELKSRENRLAYLQRQKEETIVKAPADGVVESMALRPGDLVTPNQPVARILELDQIWVRVYVPETKLGLVHTGQNVHIRVDTFPDRVFNGKIVEISSQGEYTPRNIQTLDQRNDQVFGVKVDIQPTPELKPGMAAIVELTS